MSFSKADLELLDRADEIDIETSRRNGDTQRTTIWVVVARGVPDIRSVRGPDGAWFRQIKSNPEAVIHVDGRTLKTRAVPAVDTDSIERVSGALRRKYGNTQSTRSMLVEKTLATTLRLEPA